MSDMNPYEEQENIFQATGQYERESTEEEVDLANAISYEPTLEEIAADMRAQARMLKSIRKASVSYNEERLSFIQQLKDRGLL
jgi:hypothetical protein